MTNPVDTILGVQNEIRQRMGKDPMPDPTRIYDDGLESPPPPPPPVPEEWLAPSDMHLLPDDDMTPLRVARQFAAVSPLVEAARVRDAEIAANAPQLARPDSVLMVLNSDASYRGTVVALTQADQSKIATVILRRAAANTRASLRSLRSPRKPQTEAAPKKRGRPKKES